MQRPESHALEEESKSKFQLALPRSWIKREQIPDYGFDFDIQIVDNDIVTPFHFYVQLKATKSLKKVTSGYPFVLDTEYLKLYYQGHFPVMVCLYIQDIENFFYIWIDDYFDSLNFEDYKDLVFQKYKTLYFNNLIQEENFVILEEEAKRLNYIRNPNLRTEEIFKINVFFNPIKSKIIQNKILIFFYYTKENDFFKIIEVENENASNFIINLEEKNVKIKFSNNSLEFPILLEKNNLTSEYCLLKEDYTFLKTISIPICFLLLQNGFTKRSANLLKSCLFDNKFILDQKYLFEISHFICSILSKAEKSIDILKFAKILSNLNMIETAEWYSNLGRFFINKLFEDIEQFNLDYISFLESLTEHIADKTQKGICFYNMANTLRSMNDCKKAISYYFKAKDNFLEYLKRPYWWAELAGCFFMINKYFFSEKFYKKATDLGEANIPTQPLMADALLYQGKYSKAVEVYDHYFSQADFPDSDFLLKFTLSKFLNSYFPDNKRNPDLVTETVNKIIFSNKGKKEKAIEIRNALKLDPLNGFAWYNYAVSISGEKKVDRFLEWMIVSIIQPYDLESWASAFMLMFDESFMSTDPITFVTFAGQAIKKFGNRFFISLDKILRENNFNDNDIEALISPLKKELNKISLINFQGFKPFIFRFF